MTTKTFAKGNDQFNGIFCSFKDKISVSKASSQTWDANRDPKLYFCSRSAHDIYPIQPYPYQYIEIQLNGFFY